MSAPALKFDNVRCGYGAEDVLRGLSFEAAEGEFAAIIGPNGSGKSTLVRAATRLLPLREGRVEIFGRPIEAFDRRTLARLVAAAPQRSRVDFRFTVRQVVAMGRTPHLGRFQPMRLRDAEAVERALRVTDLADAAERFVDELSGGEFQRVVVARALAQEPRLLLLDEPTSHLDINHTIEVFDLLRRLNREQGLTVLCISHDLNAAALYADRLLLLARGRLLGDGPAEDILTESLLFEAYAARVIVSKHPAADRPQVSLLPRDL